MAMACESGVVRSSARLLSTQPQTFAVVRFARPIEREREPFGRTSVEGRSGWGAKEADCATSPSHEPLSRAYAPVADLG